jgi:putative ABC transport system permease protein
MDTRPERRFPPRARAWWAELRQDAAHAARIVRRSPAFAAATVLTLALGLGGGTAAYAALHAYLVRPLPFPAADRLVAVNPPERDRRGPPLDDVDWTPAEPLFETTAAWDLDGFTIVGEPYAENVTGAWVSPGFFPTFGLRVAVGRPFRDDEYRAHAPVAIISHALWTRRFASDPAIVGRTITVHSTDRADAPPLVTVVGVAPRGFWPIHWRESELLRPLPPDRRWMPTMARLGAGVSREATERQLDAVVRAQLSGPVDPGWHMRLVPALERHSAGARPLLVAVLGAALFMLVAACASVAGALVSRTATRHGELAIRRALGGTRGRVVRQLLTESAVLATLAGALGLAIAYVLLDLGGPLVERRLGATTPGGAAALRPTAPIMTLALLAGTVAGVVLGLVPALAFLRLDRAGAGPALSAAGRGAAARAGGGGLRRVLIAAQVAVATVLLFGAGLMVRSVARMSATPFGFRAEGVMTATVLLPQARYADSTARRRVMDRLLTEVGETRGVRGAAGVFPLPFGQAWRFPVRAEGASADESAAPPATVFTVTPGYFATMEVPLRAGRTFRDADGHAAPLVVVVGEGLARRLAPTGSVVGRRIRVRVPHAASFDDVDTLPWRTVVGVVGDTRKEFALDPLSDVYVPYAQNPRALQSLVVRADRSEAGIVEPVRRAVAGVDPALALTGVGSLADIVASEGGQRRALGVLLGAFAAFALGLCALALYASLSYTVAHRRPELGIRMAIGADARSIVRLVVGEGLATAVLGLALGVAASLALGRVLESQVYGVTTDDPATLAAIALVLLLAVAAACALPGVRAARTDPASALRESA